MLTLSERTWVINMLHSCPDVRYLTEPVGREWLRGAIDRYIGYLIDQDGLFIVDPLPLDELGDWVRRIVSTSPRAIIDGQLEREIVGYAASIIESPLLHALANPEVLNRVCSFLNVRSIVALSAVNTVTHVGVRKTYDPFAGSRGRVMLGNMGVTTTAGLRTEALLCLARHAFNAIHDRVPKTVDKKRGPDVRLSSWSKEAKYGKAQAPFIGTNCVAEATVDRFGRRKKAVNFIAYGNEDRQNLVSELDLDADDYRATTHMHAEMRLAEQLDDVGRRGPIWVDKLCCPFCTVQLMVMGRLADTRGSTVTKLQWYTFSPYIIYFRDRRAQIWGVEIEVRFNALSTESKLIFLELLAKSCQTQKYIGLQPLRDLKGLG